MARVVDRTDSSVKGRHSVTVVQTAVSVAVRMVIAKPAARQSLALALVLTSHRMAHAVVRMDIHVLIAVSETVVRAIDTAAARLTIVEPVVRANLAYVQATARLLRTVPAVAQRAIRAQKVGLETAVQRLATAEVKQHIARRAANHLLAHAQAIPKLLRTKLVVVQKALCAKEVALATAAPQPAIAGVKRHIAQQDASQLLELAPVVLGKYAPTAHVEAARG